MRCLQTVECSFGEKFRGELQLTVVLRTSKGVYLTDGKGFYLLHDGSYGLIHFGAGIASGTRIFERAEFSEGQSWTFRNEALYCGQLCLVSAPLKEKVFALKNKRNTDAIKRLLSQYGKGLFAERSGFLWETVKSGVSLLKGGFFESDEKKLDLAVNMLVGLGKGLTPDSDDFLTGMTYAFYAFGTPKCFAGFIEALSKAAENTAPISGEYLRCAVENGKFEIIESVTHDLGNEQAIKKLISVGHSSGTSICYGILTAAEWLNEDANGKIRENQ